MIYKLLRALKNMLCLHIKPLKDADVGLSKLLHSQEPRAFEVYEIGDKVLLYMDNNTTEEVTITEIRPHDTTKSVYYVFSNGYVERDIRLRAKRI